MPAAVVAVAAVLAGTALLGVAAGFTWAAVAPRALGVVVSRGSADVVNPETNAFIAADGWFTLVTAVGGIISGLLGYLFAVRRHGAPAMAAVLVGGLPAALIAMWIGQQSGAAAYNHALQAGQPGVLVHAPLSLGRSWGARVLVPVRRPDRRGHRGGQPVPGAPGRPGTGEVIYAVAGTGNRRARRLAGRGPGRSVAPLSRPASRVAAAAPKRDVARPRGAAGPHLCPRGRLTGIAVRVFHGS